MGGDVGDFNNDVNNCGGCNLVCTNPHGTRACTSAQCNPLCDRGWQSCDGNLNNGCETLRWTGSSCPSGYVGTLSGDTGGDVIVRSGFGEAQYKVQIAENNDGIVYLSAEFALVNPTGVDVDLCVTCYGCGNSPAQCSRLGKGKTDIVFYQRDDHWFPFGIDDTRDVIVEVRFGDVDRTACGNWTLYMYGNINTDGQQFLYCND